jgi:Sigma-70 factor, region 1.
MATKAANKASKETEKPEAGAPEASNDSPLIDQNDAAVKKLIKVAKKRGYVTYEELNAVLPSDEVSSEQIEDFMSMFSEMGINVVDEDEVEETEVEKDDDDTGSEVATATGTAVANTSNTKSGSDRTDDPVRMYLREMGSVELLSREGEIAIAKRIEAGRETMIEGLCESPLTFQAIIIWREQLAQGEILLRDIIDLEATYAGPDAKQAAPEMPVAPPRPSLNLSRKSPRLRPSAPARATTTTTFPKSRKLRRTRSRKTTTSSTTPCRCRPWRPNSSRRWWKPSTVSPRPMGRCAKCRTGTPKTVRRPCRKLKPTSLPPCAPR